MPYLILSDMHGNREALEAVVAHAQGRYDEVLCLGDLVGYGPDPDFVVDWARANVRAIIRGNHDRVISRVLRSTLTAQKRAMAFCGRAKH